MKTPSRPVDPFSGAKPRPAETIKAHETQPEEIMGKERAAAKKRAVQLCRGGMPAPDAAREVQVPLATVKRWREAEGVTLTPGRPGPKPGASAPPAPRIPARPLLVPEGPSETGPAPRKLAAQLREAIDALPPGDVTVSSPAALPEGVELPPVAVTVKPQLPAHAFEWKAPEITPAPVVEAPAPANPEITPAAAARFAETAGAIDPPRRTARGGQLEVALPELPAPQHVEVYVGPPRAAQVERLDACILAALVALREGIKSSDWACVRVAAAILNETGGAR